jgi:DNA-binding IclR family transcriptional regulator
MSDIQSIRRAFNILRVIGATQDGTTLTDISAQLALPKSTVSRMLSTLAQVGAVEKLGGREGFRLGNELLALSANAPYPRNLAAVARPMMQQLAQVTGETLTLSVPDGDRTHYIDQINSSRNILLTDWRRQKLPLHATGDGKVFMAEWSDESIARYAGESPQRFTQNTLTQAAALQKAAKLIRKQGYAWTDGELDDDIIGIGAPIRDAVGAVVAALCVFGPRFRFPSEDRASGLIMQTQKAAEAISKRLKGSTVIK